MQMTHNTFASTISQFTRKAGSAGPKLKIQYRFLSVRGVSPPSELRILIGVNKLASSVPVALQGTPACALYSQALGAPAKRGQRQDAEAGEN